MLPISRSLFALAALIAVVNAQYTGKYEYNCAEVTFGEMTSYPITLEPVVIPAGGARITVPDDCPAQYGAGYYSVGETIKACLNTDEQQPEITEGNPPDLSPVDVACPDGCTDGGIANIVQYCSNS